MDLDSADFAEVQEHLQAKLSADEAPTPAGQDEGEEPSYDEGNSIPDGTEAPGENARGEEEHGTPEARASEDPPAPSTPPVEDRVYAGRYKDPDSLEQAYRNLEAEFTRRSAGQAQLEQRLQEAERARQAMEMHLRFAAGKPELSAERLQQLREKADAWGVSEEMLVEQELEKLTAAAQASRAEEQQALRAVGHQAGLYLQQHPNAQQDIQAVAGLVEEHQALLTMLPWANPQDVVQSTKGLIDLMYDAAEGRRLRAEAAAWPQKLEAARQQMRQEIAEQEARKASSGNGFAPRTRSGRIHGSESPESAKQEIMAIARGRRRWVDGDE